MAAAASRYCVSAPVLASPRTTPTSSASKASATPSSSAFDVTTYTLTSKSTATKSEWFADTVTRVTVTSSGSVGSPARLRSRRSLMSAATADRTAELSAEVALLRRTRMRSASSADGAPSVKVEASAADSATRTVSLAEAALPARSAARYS
eukprot:5606494-Pyramimonas_sp.AAC.2